jgi:hypothetical protein
MIAVIYCEEKRYSNHCLPSFASGHQNAKDGRRFFVFLRVSVTLWFT